jgi:transcriptional regulator with XRE-family HTH domain
MSFEGESTVRSRELGDELRLAMERADLTGKRIAELLCWSETKVSRILTGHAPPSEVDLSAILALCGVVGTQRDYLLRLCKDDMIRNHSTGRNSLLGQQRKSRRITEFQHSLVPTLLQQDRYAQSVLASLVNTDEEEADLWTSRQRQAQSVFGQLNPRPPICTFFISEPALRAPIGGPEVMLDQLHYILRMSTRRCITVRIVPAFIGAHSALSGSFCFMEFTEFRPVVYTKDELNGHFSENDRSVISYQKIIAGLATVALDETKSVKLIQEIVAN